MPRLYSPSESELEIISKQHTWTVEVGDAGPGIGEYSSYFCPKCGASGGPADMQGTPWYPFLAGEGLEVSLNCDEAKQVIAAHQATEEYKKRQTNLRRYLGQYLLEGLKKVGVQGGLGRRGLVYGGIPDGINEVGKTNFKHKFVLEPILPNKGWTLHVNNTNIFTVCIEETLRVLTSYYRDLSE